MKAKEHARDLARSSHPQFRIILAHSIVEEIKTELEIVHVALFFDTSIKISMAVYTKNYPSEKYYQNNS